MKSAIEDMFYEKSGMREPRLGKAYRNAIEEAGKKEEKLLELLKDKEELLKVFKDYREANAKSLCEEMVGYYKQGFRNGFRIALDATDEDDD